MPSSVPPLVVHNGVLRPATDGIVAVGDGLAVCGRGAFETLAAYRGRPFRACAHFARLRRALPVLELTCPADDALLTAMSTALEANGLLDAEKARLRVTLASPPDGSTSWWVEATGPPLHPDVVRVVTGPFFRNERSPISGLKTINFADNIVARRFALGAGADEVLFANTRDELCEGTWSNAFVRIDGRWTTPPLSSGCLPGVTRAVVLELFRDLSLTCAESTLSIPGLDRVESAFLTSSLREIQPVTSLDGRKLEIGEEIRSLQKAYRSSVAREIGNG